MEGVARWYGLALISVCVLPAARLCRSDNLELPLHLKLLKHASCHPGPLRLRGGSEEGNAEDLSAINEEKNVHALGGNFSEPGTDGNASHLANAVENVTETTNKKRRLEPDDSAKSPLVDSPMPTCMQTSNGEYYFELEAPKQYKTGAREEITQRRLTVSKYRDQTYVSIREFYAKDGQMLPGKKGISLHLDQWRTILKLEKSVEDVLSRLDAASE